MTGSISVTSRQRQSYKETASLLRIMKSIQSSGESHHHIHATFPIAAVTVKNKNERRIVRVKHDKKKKNIVLSGFLKNILILLYN